MIAVIGGVYEEIIMHPFFHEVYGSGGRAATALAKLSEQVTLHTYLGKNTYGQIQTRAVLDKFEIVALEINKSPRFYYDHGLLPKKLPKLLGIVTQEMLFQSIVGASQNTTYLILRAMVKQ